MIRAPSCIGSTDGKRSSLPGDAPEDGPDGHANSGQVPFAENITRHDFAGREDVGGWSPGFHQDARLLVHLYSEIRECNSGTKWIAEKWRLVDGLRPMRFRRCQACGPAIVQRCMVK